MLPNLKHFLTLIITFVFLLQTTLQAYPTLETTTMQGSNIETIAGTNLVVGGTFTINGDDLTAELYDGVLTSQATREDPALAQQAIKDTLNTHIADYLESV